MFLEVNIFDQNFLVWDPEWFPTHGKRSPCSDHNSLFKRVIICENENPQKAVINPLVDWLASVCTSADGS